MCAFFCHVDSLFDGADFLRADGRGRLAFDQTECLHETHGLLCGRVDIFLVNVFVQSIIEFRIGIDTLVLDVTQCLVEDCSHILTGGIGIDGCRC